MIDPESIQVGQCYLMDTGRIRRVTELLPGRVRYQQRPAHLPWRGAKTDIVDIRSFAFMVERPVPCDWTPGSDASSTGRSDQ
jgi:hypothetical protein